MFARRFPICLLLLALCVNAAASAFGETNAPVRLAGVVTWVDAGRGLIVLQQNDNVEALLTDLSGPMPTPGERIVVEGNPRPFFMACPNYPDRPDGQQIRGMFEAPTNWGDFFLARLSGVLHPPVSGNYTFWVASDDSSELWLSENEDRTKLRRIALVPSGRWTDPRQWTKMASQQSSTIRLEAGKAYYLEALGQDTSYRDNLAVAWRGPGIAQQVIGGEHVTLPVSAQLGTTNGLLWECWTNFLSTDFSVLRTPSATVKRFTEARIVERSPAKLPAPVRVREGQIAAAQVDFRRVELEGRVNFLSQSGSNALLELRSSRTRVQVMLPADSLAGAVLPNESLVRVIGVFEPAPALDSATHSGKILAETVNWVERPENWSLVEEVPQNRLNIANPQLSVGRILRVQGRVVAQESPEVWRLDGKDTIAGYVSADGTNWTAAGPVAEMHLPLKTQVGFAIASHRADELATVNFDHISGLPSRFSGSDVGSPPLNGAFTGADGAIELKGSGDDIWHQADQCFFTHQEMEGDFEVRARLNKFKASDSGAKAVLMIRESLGAASPWVGVALMTDGRVSLQLRAEVAGTAAGAMTYFNQPEKWVRLERRRNSFLVVAPPGALKVGDVVEVMGRVGWSGNRVKLDQVRFRNLPAAVDSSATMQPPDPPPGEYREIPIMELGAEARRALKSARLSTLKVRGVVTFNAEVGGEWISLLQDQSGAVRIQWKVRAISHSLDAR